MAIASLGSAATDFQSVYRIPGLSVEPPQETSKVAGARASEFATSGDTESNIVRLSTEEGQETTEVANRDTRGREPLTDVSARTSFEIQNNTFQSLIEAQERFIAGFEELSEVPGTPGVLFELPEQQDQDDEILSLQEQFQVLQIGAPEVTEEVEIAVV